MDPANGDEAVREALLDVEEGADIVMVKPALPYLDIDPPRQGRDAACRSPRTTSAASTRWSRRRPPPGCIDERAVVLETLTSIRRAGADIVITYHAKDAARWLQTLTATPKVRSRKDGAAVPLDDLDRRLLNLMQGSFPIEPRPYARVAERAEVPEDEVLARVAAAARRADHPPGHADLRHARARLRLDARRREGRPRAPVARGEGHQLAPRRLAQLPAQPRVQHVVHDRRRGGLAARPAGHARRARRS